MPTMLKRSSIYFNEASLPSIKTDITSKIKLVEKI
jgi:hypothetical protein